MQAPSDFLVGILEASLVQVQKEFMYAKIDVMTLNDIAMRIKMLTGCSVTWGEKTSRGVPGVMVGEDFAYDFMVGT